VSGRMLDYLFSDRRQQLASAIDGLFPPLPFGQRSDRSLQAADRVARESPPGVMAPLENVWLGVSVEDQHAADARIQDLLETPAAVRFLSCEPLLGPIDITRHLWGLPGEERCRGCPRNEDCECAWQTRGGNARPAIGWVIAGGESGPGRRPMNLAWMRSLRDQCAEARVPFFGKQIDKVRAIPPDLMVRQFPPPPPDAKEQAHDR
jgi:protein gp37